LKIVMTGGGTGGHLYPALAVAEALKKLQKEVEIHFIGSTHGIESREVPEAGYPFRGLATTGFPRRVSPRSFAAVVSFLRAILAARGILRELAPQVVFSTGGYASAPVVVAARLERIPIVLHEQNSLPGVTNRLSSRFAAEVFLAFASARRFFAKRRHLRLSGNPLREQVTAGSRTRALRLFRLEEDRRTVLVFGGSQGARSINDALLGALPKFVGRNDLQFLIQTGQADYDRVVEGCREIEVKVWARRFIANMGDAYALADLVVCRSGAMTVSELAACGLPSILVPYPHATGNHQRLNAEMLAEAGAALIIEDGHLDGNELARAIEELLAAPRRLREMSVNALRAARPDAAGKIGAALLKYRPASEYPPEPEPWVDRAPGRGPGLRRSGPPRESAPRRGPNGSSDRAPGGGRPGSSQGGRGGPGRGGPGRGGPGRSNGPSRGGQGRSGPPPAGTPAKVRVEEGGEA
jgi:UDP-N-acetylglucosamine--N-acetylmuramyl-(pentapeptide) pyrophosphoryl-undecaprenol N-acetylglucosamine transferase